MSEPHGARLLKLRREMIASREASHAAADGRTSGALEGTADEFRSVVVNIEKTYLRLCAEVEAMIYRHLGDPYRFDGLPSDERAREKVAADALMEAVRTRVKPRTTRQIPDDKYAAARAVYAYRNRLAHGDRSRQPRVTIERAFLDLESMLLELPNMVGTR